MSRQGQQNDPSNSLPAGFSALKGRMEGRQLWEAHSVGERGVSQAKLPLLCDMGSLAGRSSNPPPRSEVTTNTSVPQTIKEDIDSVLDEQGRRRMQLTQTVAALLMKSVSDRKSNVLPVFATDPDTRQLRMLPEDVKCTKPKKKLLIAPCLDIAVGSNVTGKHRQKLVVPKQEKERCMQKGRASNNLLFSWWEERNSFRDKEGEIAALEDELGPPLWSCFRHSLTEEESRTLLELRRMQEPTLVRRTGAESLMETTRYGNCNNRSAPPVFIFQCAERGISMPLKLYEKLFRSVMRQTHKRFLMLLQCQRKGGNESIEIPFDSGLCSTEYAKFLLQSQLQMMKARGMLSGEVDNDQANGNGGDDDEMFDNYPPLVSIPDERCFRPLLAAETALSVTLLWRILDSAKTMVPGMGWALQLYTQYVLPHVYDNFSLYEQHIPLAGAIGEQVEQVHALPLNLIQQRNMLKSTVQASEDLRCMEWAMKSWSLRSWRGSIAMQKHCERRRKLLDRIFMRLHRMIVLQKCFTEWRINVKEGLFFTELDAIANKYDSFLMEARHAAQSVRLFPELGDGAPDNPLTVINKNKFVAMKLAETAKHEKVKKKIVSVVQTEQTSDADGEKKVTTEDLSREGEKMEENSVVECAPLSESPPPHSTQSPSPVNANESLSPGETTVKPQTQRKTSGFVSKNKDDSSRNAFARSRATKTFDSMLQKLQEMESVSGYLRQEIAIQNHLIEKLERENKCLKAKATELEESFFHSESLQLHYCNLSHEKDVEMRKLERRISQLKSRLRCQRQRPWQRTLMRVIGDICGATSTISERLDDKHVNRKMTSSKSGAIPVTSVSTGVSLTSETQKGDSLSENRMVISDDELTQDTEDADSLKSLGDLALGADEERLFGKIAPLVITSTRFMPDAQTILRDWANNCLDDLESLDDLRGGSLSNRFLNFSEEVRNGVLLSRLLFYLALPRYQSKTAVVQTRNLASKRRGTENMDFMEHRRRLLLRDDVQLESPFPTYSECFGDLLNLKPSGRMSLLLQFATELIEGPEQLGDEYIQKRMSQIREAALMATKMAILPPVDRLELLEVVDPYALARGDRCATLTLVALLYVRFAHPFNHKAKQSSAIELEAMLYLLSGGTYEPQERDNALMSKTDCAKETPTKQNSQMKGNDEEDSIAQKLLAQLEEEEYSPWQLFQKYCQPLINTMAHPFILRGNFWPSLAFDSPDLAAMLGSLGLALNRSLQEHRWHIIMSCLIPVRTYSGLSRGIFTGRRASPIALQAGLEREGGWFFPLELTCLQKIFLEREELIQKAIETGELQGTNEWQVKEVPKDGEIAAMDKSRLIKAFESCENDLLQLFLQRSTLSTTCAMPALDLGNWRLLWIDIGLIIPDKPEESPLDLEQVTVIFYSVTGAMMDWKRSLKSMEMPLDTDGSQQLAPLCNEMYYPEFLAALVLLTHELFPPLSISNNLHQKNDSDDSEEKKGKVVVWIADSLLRFVFKNVVPRTIVSAEENPETVLKRLRSNLKTQNVLVRHNKVLLSVFSTYCKDVCGVSAMEREQLLQMLRDAMLTSTEISQNLIYELFYPCSVKKKTEDFAQEERRREQDARPRDVAVQRRRVNVNIVEPENDVEHLAGRNKEFNVLLYDGFLDFLCVLCHFKQPNPLVPFDQRLDLFLRRGLLRPLAYRNDALAGLMSHERRT